MSRTNLDGDNLSLALANGNNYIPFLRLNDGAHRDGQYLADGIDRNSGRSDVAHSQDLTIVIKLDIHRHQPIGGLCFISDECNVTFYCMAAREFVDCWRFVCR